MSAYPLADGMQRRHELIEARNEIEARRIRALKVALALTPQDSAWQRGYARGLADAVHLLEEVIER